MLAQKEIKNNSKRLPWAVTHPPRVPPHSPKDLRHLINAGQKIAAWKEKCQENEKKCRIVKLQAQLKNLQGSDAEDTSKPKPDAEDEAQEQEDPDEANPEF